MSKLEDLKKLLEDVKGLKEEYSYLCNNDEEVNGILEDTEYNIEEVIENEKDYPTENYTDSYMDNADDVWNDRCYEEE